MIGLTVSAVRPGAVFSFNFTCYETIFTSDNLYIAER